MSRKVKNLKTKVCSKTTIQKTVETNDSDPLETAFLSTTFRRERNVFPTFDNVGARTASQCTLRFRSVNIKFFFVMIFDYIYIYIYRF